MRSEVTEFASEVAADHPAKQKPDHTPPTSGADILLPSGPTTISQAANQIFARMAKHDLAFYRGGAVYEVAADFEGRLRLEPLTPDALRSRIEKLGPTFSYIVNQRGAYCLNPKRPTGEACKAILATTEAREILRPIANVYGAPVLIVDSGELRVLTKGYHGANGGAFVCDGDNVPQVEPMEAAAALLGLLVDFHFVTDADRSRGLSTIITPALRFGGFLRGNSPVHCNEADQSQTGKGYNLEMVAAVYAERPALATMKSGGVGSFDESLSQRLIDGRPFLQLDNLRGKLDSQFLEAVLTAPGEIGCRIPHRGEVYINPRRYFFTGTSNGFESTVDLANRSCITRFRKQPRGYRFKVWPEGDLIEHVKANQAFYLGCVHSIIRDWWSAGAPKTDASDHDFRDWARTVEGIIRHAWPDSAPLLDGHRSAQARTANPALAWLRAVCLAIEAAGRLDETFTASGIAELCAEHDIDIPGLRDTTNEDAAKKAVGSILSRTFKQDDALTVDEYDLLRRVEDRQRPDGNGTYPCKLYTIRHAAPQQPQKPHQGVDAS